MIGFQYSLLVVSLLASKALSNSNVFGEDLVSCSSAGTAMTGFDRTGLCAEKLGDAGSHHVCINLKSTTGGNFCEVTGQPDWCSGESPCHDDETKSCPIQNWCVCEWAFASYIEEAGGCAKIQELNCKAINKVVLDHYKQEIDDGDENKDKYQKAYDCIQSRCLLSTE